MVLSLCAAAGALLSLAFAFMNGVNDCGIMAASVVSSRCFSPRRAALWGAAASALGALVLGSAVARTLGAGLIRLEGVPAGAAASPACAAAAALAWGLAGWRLGMPGSYTHALLGAWLGAFVGLAGWGAVAWREAAGVLAAVLVAPFLGLVAAWGAYRTLIRVGEELSPRSLPLFRAAEAWAYLALCFADGANASQKAMALWATAWMLAGAQALPEAFTIPAPVRLGCAAVFSLGVLVGSSRTLKTVGFRIFKVGTLHSLCALTASGGLVLASTLAGIPLSPGQIKSSALLGAGAGHNARAVRWDVALDVLANWALTVPGAGMLSYVLIKVIQ